MTKRILILVLCLCLGLAAGASGAESLEGRVQDFVASVYADYAAQSFAEVFSLMYPSIGDIVSEEDYVNYQSQNFEELKLHLSEIEVGEVSESPRLSGSLRQLLLDDEVIGLWRCHQLQYNSCESSLFPDDIEDSLRCGSRFPERRGSCTC